MAEQPSGSSSRVKPSPGDRPATERWRLAADLREQWASVLEQLGLTVSDQRFLAVMLTLMIGLLGVHWYRLTRPAAGPIRIDRSANADYTYRIDINTAGWVEWAQLDGIGEKLGRRIVADRETRGPFHSVDDLDRVKGIGAKTLEKLRPHLICHEPDAESP